MDFAEICCAGERKMNQSNPSGFFFQIKAKSTLPF
jgi:hypothetical protein